VRLVFFCGGRQSTAVTARAVRRGGRDIRETTIAADEVSWGATSGDWSEQREWPTAVRTT
jgi:hypothetical protein